MIAIIIALSPFLSSGLTQLLKKIPAFDSLSDTARPPVIRFVAAVVSTLYVIGGMWITGNYNADLITSSVNTLVFSLLAWLGSTGVYQMFFQKKAESIANVDKIATPV